jgi:hypothetical protein
MNRRESNTSAPIPYLIPGNENGSLSGIKYLVRTTVVPPIVADIDAIIAPK